MSRHFVATSALVCSVLLLGNARWVAAQVFTGRPFGYTRTSDIVFGSGAINDGASMFNLTLDIYRPTDIGTPIPNTLPGIVLIHGGGFTGGSKNDLNVIASSYATYGFNVVSINHRLQGQNPPYEPGPYPVGASALGETINAAFQDAKTAMGWMRDNAAFYHTDPNHIAIGGFSAGAIAAEYEAYLNTDPYHMPQAVLSFSGGMYDGIEGRIQPGGPPALLYHGDADVTVPIALELGVKARLDTLGIYNEMYVGAGLGHALTGPSPPYPPTNTMFDLVFDGKTFRQRNVEFLQRFLLVPEPSTLVLAVLGALGLLSTLAKRRIHPR